MLEGGSSSRPFWNVVSVIAPFVGAVVGCFAAAFSSTGGDPGAFVGIAKAIAFIAVFFASTILGFIAALVARLRRERPPVLTTLGILLNAIPTVGVILVLLFGR